MTVERPNLDELPKACILCTCGEILKEFEATILHWKDGHFDKTVIIKNN